MNRTEVFAVIDNRSVKKRAKNVCCEESMPFLNWNSTHALKHLMRRDKFRAKYTTDYENLLAQHVSSGAAASETSRRSRKSLVKYGNSWRSTMTSKYTSTEHIER